MGYLGAPARIRFCAGFPLSSPRLLRFDAAGGAVPHPVYACLRACLGLDNDAPASPVIRLHLTDERFVRFIQDGAQGKRDESDDDDVGPRPASDPSEGAPAKKRRVLPFENVYLEALPSAQMSVAPGGCTAASRHDRSFGQVREELYAPRHDFACGDVFARFPDHGERGRSSKVLEENARLDRVCQALSCTPR